MSILKRYCEKHNVVLHTGDNLHILLTLARNKVLLLRLKMYKCFHGIHHPIVHYYALCWNEENMLPFMLAYYEGFVDHFTIYDNYSNDNSENIIHSHANTNIKKFSMGGKINDYIYQDIKNNCWKHSRGKADYVIVGDIDEFIYHKDIHHILAVLKNNNFSIVKPFGYNMYSKEFPTQGKPITEQVKRGIREPMFDKCILFNPHAIVETNYKPGAHECHPWGRVKVYRNEDIKLLHYKNIGLEQLLARNRLYASRLSKENKEKGYGAEYLKKEQLIIQEFHENEQQATDII